jgi:hypothetical protein
VLTLMCHARDCKQKDQIISMDRKNTTLDLATNAYSLTILASDSANGAFRKSVPSLPKSPQPCLVWSLRVPGVYLTWAN